MLHDKEKKATIQYPYLPMKRFFLSGPTYFICIVSNCFSHIEVLINKMKLNILGPNN